MRNIIFSLSLILSMVVCQISEATQARVNLKDRNDSVGLIMASKYGDITFVRSLLENSANIQDIALYRALMVSSMRDHIAVVRLLLEYGADVNHPNKDASILDYESFFSEDVKRLLKESIEIYGPGL